MIKTSRSTTEHETRAQLRTEQLKSLNHLDAATIESGSPLSAAIAAMQSNHGEPLLVTEGGRLVGVITERDILMKILGRDIQSGEPVDTFMRRDPDTLTLDHTVGDALHLMDNGRYRTLPLVDPDGVIEGILRQQDILEYVAEAFPQEILNLPPRPHQIAEEPEGA